MAQVTCIRCGSDRFKAGEVQPAPQGGFFLVMPCAECDTGNTVLYDGDMEIVQALLSFMASP
jgi:predicted nucleic-acid-binding Zn-ribbon protein